MTPAAPADWDAVPHMHQDNPFYPHENGQYIDAIIHIDDATEANGCLKFLRRSAVAAAVLRTREDRLAAPTAGGVPSGRRRVLPGQVGRCGAVQHLHRPRLGAEHDAGMAAPGVRVGYRTPHNRQTGGRGMGHPGVMVHGVRPKVEGVEVNVYGNWKA